MAVTKIWPVKGRLDAVIRYAGNEEKTRLPDLTGLSAGKDLSLIHISEPTRRS